MRLGMTAPQLTQCAAVDAKCAAVGTFCAAVDAIGCARVSPHTPLRTGALRRAASGAPGERAAACATCRHRTRYGNCGEPVAAGISRTFEIVRHPSGGAGCSVHELPPHCEPPIESRLAALVAMGALDQAEADLCRDRYADCPSEWEALLDWCELAATERRT